MMGWRKMSRFLFVPLKEAINSIMVSRFILSHIPPSLSDSLLAAATSTAVKPFWKDRGRGREGGRKIKNKPTHHYDWP